MALKIFDFPYHTTSVEYPERSAQVKLGGNFLYSTKPAGPVMRTLTLDFPVLYWVRNGQGLFDPSLEPETNVQRLENFYLEHELYKDFIYSHEIYGNLVVKFAKPLKIPTAKKESLGAVLGISLTLIQQPV